MKYRLILIGKTDSSAIKELFEEYEKRLKYYIAFENIIIADSKNKKKAMPLQRKKAEGKLILEKLNLSEVNILLDEKGDQFTSKKFAETLQKKINIGVRRINFIIGGPYGFSEEVYQTISQKMALSTMTFSHQMARVFFVEQLYRAMTIINSEGYHHE